ncbi:hypothetical protein [Bradyrhizobium lablabi]|uniref:hypothetical protein n=1 Tax=Bradyrhizobium lablabi TaxID=722472 RepID=UPI001BACF7C1|nr:hypothetical protein [Bradyrhizobium lablabi]MBR0698240.1 hypothetical protein [Bradyrhizobium lablabi]
MIDPEYIIVGHCTGDRFYDLARAELGDKVIHSAAGTRLVLYGRLRDGLFAFIFREGVSHTKTAKPLDLTVPRGLRVLADEVMSKSSRPTEAFAAAHESCKWPVAADSACPL